MKIIKLKNSDVYLGSPFMIRSKSFNFLIPNYTTNKHEAACINELDFQERIKELPLKAEFLELVDFELAK